MKLFIIITIALSSLLITACASKPQYKNTTVLKKGDSMETAIAIWGEPDYVSKSTWGNIKREQWVYSCLKYPVCDDDSHCFLKGP